MSQARPPAPSQKRPKLSLQTSSLPITFGKSSTALAIAASALPAASPTVLNTFTNAYDMSHRFSPSTASPTAPRSARPSSRLVCPFASSKDGRPYQVPLGLKGILRNSPIPAGLRRPSLCPASDSPRAARRAFFPAAKKVTFRVALEEEIKTTTYTATHSDLSSDEEDSECDERSELSLSSSDESDIEETSKENTDAELSQPRKKRKARSDRQIEAAAIRDRIAGTERLQKRLKSMSQTSKPRRRRWEWTLEPLKATDPPILSPSQTPLPLSAALQGDNGMLSPSKISLPPSGTSSSSSTKAAPPLLSPSHVPLPQSATVTSPVLVPPKSKTEEG